MGRSLEDFFGPLFFYSRSEKDLYYGPMEQPLHLETVDIEGITSWSFSQLNWAVQLYQGDREMDEFPEEQGIPAFSKRRLLLKEIGSGGFITNKDDEEDENKEDVNEEDVNEEDVNEEDENQEDREEDDEEEDWVDRVREVEEDEEDEEDKDKDEEEEDEDQEEGEDREEREDEDNEEEEDKDNEEEEDEDDEEEEDNEEVKKDTGEERVDTEEKGVDKAVEEGNDTRIPGFSPANTKGVSLRPRMTRSFYNKTTDPQLQRRNEGDKDTERREKGKGKVKVKVRKNKKRLGKRTRDTAGEQISSRASKRSRKAVIESDGEIEVSQPSSSIQPQTASIIDSESDLDASVSNLEDMMRVALKGTEEELRPVAPGPEQPWDTDSRGSFVDKAIIPNSTQGTTDRE